MAQLPLDQAITRFQSNESRLDTFANGGVTDGYVSTAGIPVPSIQKFLAAKDTQINVGASSVLALSTAQAEDAEDSAIAAAASAIAAAGSASGAAGAATTAVNAHKSELASETGSNAINYRSSGLTTVAMSVQEALRNNVSKSLFDFLSDAEKADVLAGTRTLDVRAKLQTAVDTCILFGWDLHIPSQVSSASVSAPIVINYASLSSKALSIWGNATIGYYQDGAGSELYYSGSSGFMFEIAGRPADLGGVNEGSPMSVSITGINFAGNNGAFGAVNLLRCFFARVEDNNFYGWGNAGSGVVVLNAGGVTGTSPIAFTGEINVSRNHFASSGKCILLTGETGGVVNMVRIKDNVALDQDYFVSVDFGAGIPYSLAIWIEGNHIEGTRVKDIYSAGAAANLRVVSNYFEQNNAAQNQPRIHVAGSNNYGVYIEQNTFSKSLTAAGAGSCLVQIDNADGVSVVNNQSNYGGNTDRFSVTLNSCKNAEVEPFSTVIGPPYPVKVNGFVIRSGKVTDNWLRTPVISAGNFVGPSSGDGWPGGTVSTTVADYNKTNARVRFNFKSTVTTKSGGGTPLLIGILPFYNVGVETCFPVYTENVAGVKPFYGKLPQGSNVAQVYDANGAAVNYQTAISVGSVITALIDYVTQE